MFSISLLTKSVVDANIVEYEKSENAYAWAKKYWDLYEFKKIEAEVANSKK